MGYKIKELRASLNMTQEELAKKSGVSRVTIAMLEGDNAKETTTKTLAKIAQALDVPISEIFFN